MCICKVKFISLAMEKTDVTAKERVEVIAERAARLKQKMNRLLSDFKSDTGCSVEGRIKNGETDIFVPVNIGMVI